MNTIRIGLLAVAVTTALCLALAARFWMIEPRGAELMCSSAGAASWCTIRGALVPIFTYQGFGGISLATGLFAAWKHRPAWGVLALLSGAAGMVLFNVELAAVGTVLGLIAVMRENPHQAA
ncbi:MAG: hypothetical protein JXQ84_02230 [Rhodospirillaceae bacterium]|nr:hypothetical protein [Rhodospirillaceae bacterium]